MYNILEQAIIDAKVLREAALKNAETAVLERYSDEVKGAIDIMLEAEVRPVEEAIIMPDSETAEPALAAAEGEDLCGCPDTEEETEWELSLDDLKAMSDAMPEGEPIGQPALAGEFGVEEEEEFALQESVELDEEIDLVFEDDEKEEEEESSGEAGSRAKARQRDRYSKGVPRALEEEESDDPKWTYPSPKEVDPLTPEEEAGERRKKSKPKTARLSTKSHAPFSSGSIEEDIELDEDIEIDEDMVKEIVEELVVDISPQKSGWAGTPAAVMANAEEMELARQCGTEAKEEAEALQDAGDRLSVQESKKLEDENKKLKELIYAMKEKLDESILSNAKLLYTNQTLTSASLNERQKNKIVESIQDADSVEEAKVIYETLQSAAGPSTRKNPKSLSEAISRPSLNVPRRRRENSRGESVVKNRFQKLAGIKNK